jgi:hypothetical protein
VDIMKVYYNTILLLAFVVISFTTCSPVSGNLLHSDSDVTHDLVEDNTDDTILIDLSDDTIVIDLSDDIPFDDTEYSYDDLTNDFVKIHIADAIHLLIEERYNESSGFPK